MPANAKAALSLLKQTFKEWSEDKAPRLGAALAYYSVFSIGPLLLITVGLAGLLFGADATRQQVVGQVGRLVGAEGAQALDLLMSGAAKPSAGILATIAGFVGLLVGAMGVSVQLKEALNTIWEVKPKERDGWKAKLRAAVQHYVLPTGLVFAIGFLLMTSLVVSAGLAAVSKYLTDAIPGSAYLWMALTFVLSLVVITVLFALMFKYLPDAEISWRDVWIGAFGTALLFVVGELLMGLYLGRQGLGSTYGAAGSIVVLLLWIYYSAQIFLFGAEFTQVYANTYGSRIRPDEDAVAVTEEARREQGLDRNRPTG